ncbi:MAG: TSUP family transporter [Candidatus Heimdallarchaeota archaeon]|nr:TSUP family transporter [Candidatus Heimdallarchaeota archaeon]
MEPLGTFLILIPIGLAIGTIAALLGLGGGSMMVPVLYLGVFLFTTFPHEKTMIFATTISSVVILFTGISSTIAYIYQKRVDYIAGLICAVFTVGGAFLGKMAQPFVGDTAISIIFSVLLLASGIRMVYEGIKEIREKARYDDYVINNGEPPSNPIGPAILAYPIKRDIVVDNNSTKSSFSKILEKLTLERNFVGKLGRRWKYKIRLYYTPFAFIAGALAGIAGESGGILIVPILHILLNMPMHFSIGTSAFIMIFTTSATIISAVVNPSISLAGIWWPFVIGLAIGILFGAQIGSLISRRVKGTYLKLLFALVVFSVVSWSIARLILDM